MTNNRSQFQKTPVINLFNRQRKIKLDTGFLQEFLEELSGRLNLESGFSLALVSDRKIREMNRKFAGKDYSTDVLSFPCFVEGVRVPEYLGDIAVSVERAEAQAAKSLEHELKVLALHGVLHLLGYDHESDEGEMSIREERLRREFNL